MNTAVTMVQFALFPLLGRIVAASFLSLMLFRSDDAAIGLKVATSNIGSVNRNPFEYYFDDIDKVDIDKDLYHLAMEKIRVHCLALCPISPRETSNFQGNHNGRHGGEAL